MRVFLDEINIWISRLPKADYLPNMDGPYPICWRPEYNKNGRLRKNVLVLPISKLGRQSPPTLELGLEVTAVALLSLQLADCSSWDLASRTVSQFLKMNPYV